MTDDIERAIYLIGRFQGLVARLLGPEGSQTEEVQGLFDLVEATLEGLSRATDVIEASRDIVATQRRFDSALEASARAPLSWSLVSPPQPFPLLTAAMHDCKAARELHRAAVARYDRDDE